MNRLLLLLIVLMLGACAQRSRTQMVVAQRDSAAAQRHTEAGLAAMRDGELDRAVARFEQALDADAGYAPARNNLGAAHLKAGRLGEAAVAFQHAAQLMPLSAQPRNNLGMIYENVGRFDDAVRQYEEALEREPQNVDIIANLARARVRRGDRSRDLRQLLDKLILRTDDPVWRDWARQQQVDMP